MGNPTHTKQNTNTQKTNKYDNTKVLNTNTSTNDKTIK